MNSDSNKPCVACGKPLNAHLPPHDDCPMYIADGALSYHQQLELMAELSGWRARAEKAEAERDALCAALGFKLGPLEGRPVILHEIAGLRPAMVKARREAERAEGDAAMWRLSAADRHNDKPLLLTVWQQRKAAENRATAAEPQVADLTAKLDEARGVLRRFANAAAAFPFEQTHPDYDKELVDETFGLTRGDLHRAAAVIAPETGKGEEK